MSSRPVVVVGAGVFGASAALELRARGHVVTLFDQGPIPHPLAASTDVSKVLRMEYGTDETYLALMEHAFAGWRRWSMEWRAAGLDDLYHECGVLMVSRGPMVPGGFEYESWQRLLARGHRPERLDGGALAARFPAWSTGRYVDGFFHALGGFGESGRVVDWMVESARRSGVEVVERKVDGLVERGRDVLGVRCGTDTVPADHVVLAAGTWVGKLLGWAHELRSTGHPVFHLRPRDPAPFTQDRFPVFTADIANTGFYGFPLHPGEQVVKLAIHGPGVTLDPDAPRAVTDAHHAWLRQLLAETFPALLDAEVTYTRLCLYADTQDGDFWIANDPEREHLTVATGGSGHGFKFAPVLGGIIADTVERKPHPLSAKFRWRPEVRLDRNREAARYHGER